MNPAEFALTNNSLNTTIFIVIEPWGETLSLAPGSKLLIKIYSEHKHAINMAWEDGRVKCLFTLYTLDHSYLQILVDGEDKTPPILAKG